VEGSKDERINEEKKYGTKYGARTEEVVKG
jgi:hypothetical protein